MNETHVIREHLKQLLEGGQAHLSPSRSLVGMPYELQGHRPEGAPHSPWELLEHMRIAQWDILEFSRDPTHQSPSFPDGYWPSEKTPPNDQAWDESVAVFQADLQAMTDLVMDPAVDLFAPIPHGTGQTVLREALLVADHNAYHLGQMVLVRRLLGAWGRE